MGLASGENGGVAWSLGLFCSGHVTRQGLMAEASCGAKKGDILPLFNLLHPAVGRVVHPSYMNIERLGASRIQGAAAAMMLESPKSRRNRPTENANGTSSAPHSAF